jgi:23S rRNA pseudouridine955/2504/2580 synthase
MSWSSMVTKKATFGVSHVEVTQDRDGQRLDNFLMARLKGVPRSVIYRIIRTGQVRVNGGRSKPANKLQCGDMVRVPPAKTRKTGTTDIPPKVIQLLKQAICFEDSNIMVINKPAGMAVHGGSGLSWGVIDVIRTMRPDNSVDLVHRLDRETSGCLLIALNGDALRNLNAQVKNNELDKRYLCLMDGELKETVVDIYEPLGKFERGGERMMRVDPAGKPAHTTFRLLQPCGPCSFVEAQLHTGRTHQIRVHAAHSGTALIGDKKYAPDDRQKHWRAQSAKRLFLHAHQLTFKTLNGEQQMVNSPLPDDLRAFMDSLL